MSSATPTTPGVVTGAPNQVAVAAIALATEILTPPAAYTTVFNANVTFGVAYGLWVGYKALPSAGLVPDAVGSMTSSNWGSMTFAIGQ